jgi:hypothetical protein
VRLFWLDVSASRCIVLTVSILRMQAYSHAMPLITLFNRRPIRSPRHSNVQSFILWALRPFFKYKLRKLAGFTGPESYTAQMKRHRLMAALEACLIYS